MPFYHTPKPKFKYQKLTKKEKKEDLDWKADLENKIMEKCFRYMSNTRQSNIPQEAQAIKSEIFAGGTKNHCYYLYSRFCNIIDNELYKLYL